MTRKEKIAYIKSFEEPPFLEADPYCLREPWQKFGGVSSDINMRWYWFRNDIIELKATNEDVDIAYKEMLSYVGKGEIK